jgi:hypothetical protein
MELSVEAGLDIDEEKEASRGRYGGWAPYEMELLIFGDESIVRAARQQEVRGPSWAFFMVVGRREGVSLQRLDI